MSTKWHLTSTRPSSNTANSPTGPAPTMTTSVVMTLSDMNRSELLVGDAHDETVKRIGDLDLAGKPARRPYIEGEVEHVFLHLLGRAGLLAPSLVHINVAGRAGAGAAAFGGDAGDAILHRRFHHGHARLRLDHALDPIVLNKSNPGHHVGGLRSLPISGIGPRLTRARKAKARGGSPARGPCSIGQLNLRLQRLGRGASASPHKLSPA